MVFENLCTVPLQAEIFSAAIHPTEPIITVGTSSGHVETFRLPAPGGASSDDSADGDTSILSEAKNMIDALWQTRRHKGSCRCLAYSHDGVHAYSAGTDALLKHFHPLTGKVVSKMAIPTSTSVPDAPSLLHVLNPQSLLLATDSGALHIIPLSEGGVLPSKPSQTHFPHADYVSSITPLPPTAESTSGFSKQWVSTGGTTLAVTDVRRGVLVRSDDQEDELLSSCFMPGMGPKSNRNNGMIAIGSGTGVLTLWDKGAWGDQQERIIVDSNKGNSGGESIDAVCTVPASMGLGKKIVCGLGDGGLRLVDLVRREVLSAPTLRHDDYEGVVFVGFDRANRLITAGGKTVKVWEELSELQGFDPESNDEDEDEPAGEEENSAKRAMEDSDDDSDDSADGVEEMKRRAKRRKEAQQAKLGPMGAHGIMGFDGLD